MVCGKSSEVSIMSSEISMTFVEIQRHRDLPEVVYKSNAKMGVVVRCMI